MTPGRDGLCIALEVNPLCREDGTGMARYVESLVWTWKRVAPSDRLILFHRAHRRLERPVPPEYELRGYSLRGPGRWLAERSLRGADLVHHTRNRLALRSSLPEVVTLHDVWHLSRVGREIAGEPPAGHLRELRELVERRAWILTLGEHARHEILEALHPDPDRVVVVPQGLDGKFQPVTDQEVRDVRATHHLPERYVLFLGGLNERKNLPRILQAWAQVDRRTGGEWGLVLAGGGGEAWERRVPEGLRGRCMFPGYVPGSELAALYTGASAFLWPSLHEGFGLPILEAMACGCPVVTSRGTACQETAGDAALLVDPYDTEAIAEAVLKLLQDEDAARDLRFRGLARAAEFSWERTVRLTREVYLRVLAERGP